MSREKPVDGFDYVTGKPVSMLPQHWRGKYPPSTHTRRVENGETFFSRKAGKIEAEAYANVPAQVQP